MKADEIMHVLRLTAMGRVGHPDQQAFCDKLAEVIESTRRPMLVPVEVSVEDAKPVDPGAEVSVADVVTTAVVKRGPGRPKKAD